MGAEFALVSFEGINAAAEAFAAARDRSGSAAPWTSEVGFVEHHKNGHLVIRGTFAGHYIDADESVHVSGRGTEEGFTIGAVIGTLLAGPFGLAVGSVLGGTIGSQAGKPSETETEPEPLAERLREAVPRLSSAIVVIADAGDVDQMIAALSATDAQVTRSTLTPDDVAAVQASLSASPAASPGPSLVGEEAVEASE